MYELSYAWLATSYVLGSVAICFLTGVAVLVILGYIDGRS